MLNNLKVMIGLLIVAAGLAYWVSQKDNHSGLSEQPLMPDWQGDASMISKVDQVKITQSGEVIKLTKKDNHWILNDGFYASVDPLFNLLQGIKNAVIVESKTANPDNHARLELADSDLKVELIANEESMAALHVGKKTAAGLTFVRNAGESQSYVVRDLGAVTLNVDSWKLKTVLDINAEEVRSVTVAPQDAPDVSIKRTADTGEWELADLPEGQQLKEDVFLDQIANALSRFMIDDAQVKDLEGMKAVLTNNYELVNGNELVIHVYQKEEDYFMTIDSSAHTHYANWMMKIPEYKFNSLNRSIDEYIEPEAVGSELIVPNDAETSS